MSYFVCKDMWEFCLTDVPDECSVGEKWLLAHSIQVDRHICRFSIRGPPKNLENQRNKWFIILKMCFKREQAITWWNPAAQTHPVLDSSSFIPVPTLPCKLATIMLLACSLFKLVATLSQCLYSESKKKNGEVSEYPQ